MCGPKKPKEVQTPIYNTVPEPEEAPKLQEKAPDSVTAEVKAKRRGTRALRTDLSIPGSSSSSQKTGLQIQ